MVRRRLALCVTLLAAGCSKSIEHAPALSGGCTEQCGPELAGGGGGGKVGDAGGADASDAAPTVDGSGVLAGTVGYFQDPLFTTAVTYAGTGTVTLLGGAGPVSADFTDGEFSVERFVPAPAIWVLLQKDSGALDVLPTFEQVNGTAPTADLRFFKLSVLNDIYSGFLTHPTTVDATRAQVVLRFATAQGAPIQGVEVQPNPAGILVVYDTDASYSDAYTATNSRGSAIVVNAPAPVLPGGVTSVAYRSGTKFGSVDVRVAQGAVTLVNVEL